MNLRLRCFAIVALAFLIFMPATMASAHKLPILPVDEMLAQSSAVVVASVELFDRTNGGVLNGKTRIRMRIHDVLHGSVPDSHPEFVVLGGELPGNDGMWPSIVPLLVQGETYVLFLQSKYQVSPIIGAHRALLRVIRDQSGQETLADEEGYAVHVDTKIGLARGRKIAENQRRIGPARRDGNVKPSVPQLLPAQREGSVSLGNVVLTPEPANSDVVAVPATLAQLISFVRSRSALMRAPTAPFPSVPEPSYLNFPPGYRREPASP